MPSTRPPTWALPTSQFGARVSGTPGRWAVALDLQFPQAWALELVKFYYYFLKQEVFLPMTGKKK